MFPHEDAQADLSPRLVHRLFCCFCHIVAYMFSGMTHWLSLRTATLAEQVNVSAYSPPLPITFSTERTKTVDFVRF